MFKTKDHECFLKNKYDKDKKTPCADCIAYDEDSHAFVFQKIATVTKIITTSTKSWTTQTFGGGSWAEATGSEQCRFVVGFDQPKKYNLGKQLFFPTAFECCHACNENDGLHLRHLSISESCLSRMQIMGLEVYARQL